MSKVELVESDSSQDSMALKVMVKNFVEWLRFIKTKAVIILMVGLVAATIGFVSATFKKAEYTASLTFALEEDKGGGGGMSGALGIASSLGFDLGGGGAGGVFAATNIQELMKSRFVVESALSKQIQINKQKISLGEYFLQISGIAEKMQEKGKIIKLNFDSTTRVREQDSLMNVVYTTIIDKGILNVFQKDKKVSIITIQVISQDEVFSKEFAETVAADVSAFYIDTKSRKARWNYEILQRQADSVRRELGGAIVGVATSMDNTYNLNPALNVRRAPVTNRQVDVQANTAVLTQLVINLELAKVSLRKETPLIQIIDKPTLPLIKKKASRTMSAIGGMIIGVVIALVFVSVRKKLTSIL